MHYLYLIECIPTGLKYIGQTRIDPVHRFRCHACRQSKTPIGQAFAQYGRGAMRMTVIAQALSAPAANEAERRLIIQHNTRAPYGLNVAKGGAGTTELGHPPEVRAKIAAASRGRHFSPETRRKIGLANLGRRRSPETIERMSLSHLGHVVSAETRAKIGAASRARVRS